MLLCHPTDTKSRHPFYPAILNSVKAISPIKNEFSDFKQTKSPAETELCFFDKLIFLPTYSQDCFRIFVDAIYIISEISKFFLYFNNNKQHTMFKIPNDACFAVLCCLPDVFEDLIL